MNIAIIGTGYVGLTAGACLANLGNSVICTDIDREKINNLKKGIVPIFEPELEELIHTNVLENRLEFSLDINSAIKKSKVCFITVGTPQSQDGSPDLSCVYSVIEEIANAINEYKVIVNKSTVPVGTLEKMKEIIKSKTKHPFDIVSNPEFLRQGSAVYDFLCPERIIIGTDSKKAAAILDEIYSPLFRAEKRILFMDSKSAEMTKYASNTFLAAKISFMNELANLCEKLGADIDCVRSGMSMDSRIGNKFLFSGIGYGGSCFPKDVAALIKMGNDNDCEMSIAKVTKKINEKQRTLFINKITNRFGNDLKGYTFAIWGLAFKPKTNDIRQAPSVSIIKELIKKGAKIQAYDPKATDLAKKILNNKNISYCKNSYEALVDADSLLLLTEWMEFSNPDFKKIKRLLKYPIIFDGRNQYNPNILKEAGFEYYSFGRM